MKNIFTLLCALLLSLQSTAQNSAERQTGSSPADPCGHDSYLMHLLQTDPAAVQAIRTATGQEVTAQGSPRVNGATVPVIPVVFHIVWHEPVENLSDKVLQNLISRLNEDFRAMNADTMNVQSQFKSLIGDVKIEFALATLNPSGAATTGIERRYSSLVAFTNDDKVKYYSQGGLDAWNSSQYLNIWICDLSTLCCNGYSVMPGAPAATDGFVLDYLTAAVGQNLSLASNMGRTITHEAGHWLGLHHIWGQVNDGCGDDDLVSDTPLQSAPNYSCNLSNACAGSVMGDNYMDYHDDYCREYFSAGQVSRMRYYIGAGAAREAVSNSDRAGYTCKPPSHFDSGSETANSAVITWKLAGGAFNYAVKYRVYGTTTWNTVNASASPATLSGLASCTLYEYKIESNCSLGVSSTGVQRFRTGGCSSGCAAPGGLAVASQDNWTGNYCALLRWDAMTGVSSYSLRIRVAGTSIWEEITGITNNEQIVALGTDCGNYDLQVASVCGTTVTWSSVTTMQLGPCFADCPVPGTITHTGNASTGAYTLNWGSASGATGYHVYYRPTGSNDWTGPVSTATNSLAVTFTPCTNYEIKVQTQCTGNYARPYFTSYNLVALCSCTVPTGLALSGNSGTGAYTLSWTASGGASSYEIYYRVQGVAVWTGPVTSSTNSKALTLTSCTNYEFQVEAVCAGNVRSGRSATLTRSYTPTGTSETNITRSAATLNWGAVTNISSGYEINYRRTGTTTWTVTTSTTNTKGISGLSRNRTYEWRVRSKCSTTTYGPWSATDQFTTLNKQDGDEYITWENSVQLFPVPASEVLNILVVRDEASPATLTVADVTGRVLQTQPLQLAEGEQTLEIGVQDFAPGIYFIAIQAGESETIVKKFTVAR